jgi:phosphatidylserine/phosphatidylglycerophosphate/cardiolipin synthase-like enzyme
MGILHPPRTIVVPIATDHTHSATLTLPWFVQRATYSPKACAFEALVNGEAAFGAIYDAIEQATTSIDIICWGFQPSMYFKRQYQQSATNLTIGQLLDKKAEQGCIVRLLRWKSLDNAAQFVEDPAPGANPKAMIVDHVLAALHLAQLKDTRTTWQKGFDLSWYHRVQVTGKTLWRLGNLRYATRDMGLATRTRIAREAGKQTEGAQASTTMALFPTHHQKMVLIDYDAPARSVAFVMGHNMLDAYWDTNDHSPIRKGPAEGRNGATPRQDMSSRLYGPILLSLNHNFCQAWDQATGEGLWEQRKVYEPEHQQTRERIPNVFGKSGTPVMAQILRTQPEHGETDIQRAYAQAVNNVTSYLYIENQYFRYPKLAGQIKAAFERQVRAGRPPDRYPIHLFAVTNASDEGIGPGTLRTYELISALGRADVMPGIALEDQKDNLQRQYEEACNAELRAHAKREAIARSGDIGDTQAQVKAREHRLVAAEAQRKAASDQQDALQKQMNDATRLQKELERNPDAAARTVLPKSTPGLKVHICSLVADDWTPIYIHSKLMLIDDCFTTLGSANINVRSMEADSELNICHEMPSETTKLRKMLWNLHTRNRGGQDNVGKAFEEWKNIIDKNKKNRAKKLPPIASLIGFIYTGTVRKSLD